MKKIFKFLFTISFGYISGLLFAQKPGKKFREEIKKSQNPIKTIFTECKNADMEAYKTITEWVKNSKELQNVIDSGKNQFEDFVKAVKKLGKDAQKKAEKELENLSDNAKDAAKAIKKSIDKKGQEIKKTFDKKVKTIAQKIKK